MLKMLKMLKMRCLGSSDCYPVGLVERYRQPFVRLSASCGFDSSPINSRQGH